MSGIDGIDLETQLTRRLDYDYIEHIIYGEDRSVKCYKIIQNNVPDDKYNLVYAVRTKYRPLPVFTEIPPQVDSSPPVVLQVQILGTVCWTTLGEYGNWVPKNEVCPDDIKHPEDKIFSAKLSMGLRVDEMTKNYLETVDQDIKQELLKTYNNINKWNKMGGSGDYLTLKSPLVMYKQTWKKYQEARNNYKASTPPLTSESDPSDWFRKYAPEYAVVDKDCQPRFFRIDIDAGEITLKRTEIKSGDFVKALVSFKTYLFPDKEGQLIGGVTMIFDEVQLIETGKQVRLQE
ncbi:hypothetical protein BC936DRAFT_144588 [Jimgerdemannia flammicorona]|uniref:Uncharacterized protein n=1 Tax=Jimgerdemannia flammicorona TaxID=994334 RepID=A0A433DC55_9FUNG|nr:hypothetical protein BC936DRAFT_144588 [Jimgerdemannia flammicorona]